MTAAQAYDEWMKEIETNRKPVGSLHDFKSEVEAETTERILFQMRQHSNELDSMGDDDGGADREYVVRIVDEFRIMESEVETRLASQTLDRQP